jgi:hypothetical protein
MIRHHERMVTKEGMDTILGTLDHLIVSDDLVLECKDTLVNTIFENIIPGEGRKVGRKLRHAFRVRMV